MTRRGIEFVTRHLAMVLAGVAAVITLSTLAACSSASTTASGTPTAVHSHPSSPAVLADPHVVCTIEVLAGVDAITDNGGSYQALLESIGNQTEIFRLSFNGYQEYQVKAAQVGSTAAQTAVRHDAADECTSTGNPALTRGQLNSLVQLVPREASLLHHVSHFGLG